MLIEDLTPYLIGGLVGVGIGALIGIVCTMWLNHIRTLEAEREPDWDIQSSLYEIDGHGGIDRGENPHWRRTAHPNWAAGPVDGEKPIQIVPRPLEGYDLNDPIPSPRSADHYRRVR